MKSSWERKGNDSIWLNEIFISHNSRISLGVLNRELLERGALDGSSLYKERWGLFLNMFLDLSSSWLPTYMNFKGSFNPFFVTGKLQAIKVVMSHSQHIPFSRNWQIFPFTLLSIQFSIFILEFQTFFLR